MASKNTNSEPGSSFNFSGIQGFDVGSVEVSELPLDLWTAVPEGTHPTDQDLGESCGDLGCCYPAFELIGFPRKADLVEALIRDTMRRWPDIPPVALIEGLRLNVFRATSLGRVRVASLREHPICYRVPVSIKRLKATGHRAVARQAPEWELMRVIKDVHQVAVVDLPLRAWEAGQDLAVYRDHATSFAFTNEGRFAEVVPLTDDAAGFWLKLFTRVLGG